MKKLILKIPTPILIIMSIFLGLAPFQPEPHLIEKLRFLANGTLTRPIDIFDLLMHSTPLVLLITQQILRRNA